MLKSLLKNMKNKKLPISVTLVIYNEERLLERCLLSVVDLVDEILIVHDGPCSDNSLTIARKYTNKIFTREHFGHSEAHRIFTYENTKNNWILQLDADEYLSDQLRENLAKLIEEDVDIYEFPWPVQHKGKHYYSKYKRSLFKKNKVYFIQVIHEYIRPLDNGANIKRIAFPIFNDPEYENVSWAIFRSKWMKWAKINARELSTSFAKIPKWNCVEREWDFKNKIRLRYPLLFGAIGSFIYIMIISLFNSISKKSMYYLIEGYYTGLYFIVLYFMIFKIKMLKHE